MFFDSLRYDFYQLTAFNSMIYDLPSPSKMSYSWNFGSLLGLMLGLQMGSGMIMSMHYNASAKLAFETVLNITREMKDGWYMRKIHVLGASFYFLLMYMHIGRGMWNYSFSTNKKVWLSGVTMFLLSMGAAFFGYVLPWGQMSFWGASVITKFLSVMPIMGGDFMLWLWGGFSVKEATLVRFFSFHFFMPFIILFFVLMHVVMLHENGSSNPLGMFNSEKLAFYPFFTNKDIFGFSLMFFLGMWFFFWYPEAMAEEQKYIKANPLITPEHIQPEWYFLPAYAVLRCVPKKAGGVVALVVFVLILYIMPLLSFNPLISNKFLLSSTFFLWCMNYLFLIWCGAQVVEDPFMFLSQMGFMMYFGYYLFLFTLNFYKV